MYDYACCSVASPVGLQAACIDFICKNLETVCRGATANAVDESNCAASPLTGDVVLSEDGEAAGANGDDDDLAVMDVGTQSSESPARDKEEEASGAPGHIQQCKKTAATATYASSQPSKDLSFPSKDMFFPTSLSEQLLERLGERRQVCDSTLMLFDPCCTRLARVRLSDASRLTKTGLKVLKGHPVTELEAHGLTKATVTDLIGCLGEWSVFNLRKLDVTNSTFVDRHKYTISVALTKLKNLRVLDVSATEFNRTSLEMVVDDLLNLEELNISMTKVNDISCLSKAKHRLKALSMYGLRLSSAAACESAVEVLSDMKQLLHLDISDEHDGNHPLDVMAPGARIKTEDLLKKENSTPNIVSLDLSGKEDIDSLVLYHFIVAHPHLRFLGLLLTTACKEDMFVDETSPNYLRHIQLSGSEKEVHVLEALRRYANRPQYVQKCLYHLFKLTQSYAVPRPDIIQLVVDAANKYQTVFAIQMAATACLFNLSKGEIGQKLHPHILHKIVCVDLNSMEEFPQHQQLQKNVLLAICSDRILQEVSFDRYRCAKLVMDCLCKFEDPSMNRMCVAICSILAAKISTKETSELGNSKYMKQLLTIVKRRKDEIIIDVTLKFTLSALWNLTDESPKTCSVFLEEGGMELFLGVLEAFPGETSIETKVLGLLNNIAEVSSLRHFLMIDSFVDLLWRLMHSKHIDVSYFAAGIVAHLCSEGEPAWPVTRISWQDMTKDLCQVVSGWETPSEEMVAYRSFKPFFPLMGVAQPIAVQLWALWAIHHVCSKNAPRYCPMLVSQGGGEVVLVLVSDPSTDEQVVRLADRVIHTLVGQGLVPPSVLEKYPYSPSH